MSSRPSILLLCTGNTCRSPMAAAILRQLLDAHRQADHPQPSVVDSTAKQSIATSELIDIRSAGLGVACPGEPASAHVLTVLAEHGICLAGHAAQPVTAQHIDGAGLILTMTWAHKHMVLARFPEAGDRVFTLTEYTRGGQDAPAHGGLAPDIADPIGGDLATYHECAVQLEQELSRLVEQMAGEEVVALPHTVTPPRPPLLEELTLTAVEPSLEQVALPRLAVGADHAGYELKDELAAAAASLGCEVIDFGTCGPTSVDYPDFAALVANAVADGDADAGLLVCGSGLGMAIAANKIPGIRAVTANDLYCARMAREHNDANILSLGARIVGPGLAVEILRTFLTTPFGGDRHVRRIRKISDLERDGKDR